MHLLNLIHKCISESNLRQNVSLKNAWSVHKINKEIHLQINLIQNKCVSIRNAWDTPQINTKIYIRINLRQKNVILLHNVFNVQCIQKYISKLLDFLKMLLHDLWWKKQFPIYILRVEEAIPNLYPLSTCIIQPHDRT